MDILEQLVDYSRQQDMTNDLNHIQNGRHMVVGCGGIGYWLALQLAMLGTPELTLVDGDRIETTNMNRVPAPARSIGEFKVKVLKAQIRMLRPRIKVTCLPCHITPDTLALIGPMGTVWDCTDDARIQMVLSPWVRTRGMRYIKAGYEGWKVGAYTRMENTWLQDGYTPGYTTNKANVLSSMMAASLAIMYAGVNGTNAADMHIDLRQLVEVQHE